MACKCSLFCVYSGLNHHHYHDNSALAVSGLEDYYGLFLQHVLLTAGRCCYGKSKYSSGAERFVFLFCKGSALISRLPSSQIMNPEKNWIKTSISSKDSGTTCQDESSQKCLFFI